MQLRFLGANRQVTGSCTLLEVAGRRVLVDIGLHQEPAFSHRNRESLPVPAEAIDVVLLTHAHLDHTGRLPWLYEQGFRGRVLATAPTVELARLVLMDAARLQAEDDGPEAGEALYDEAAAASAAERIEPVPYWEAIELTPDLAVRFRDAGHILGSASIEVMAREDDRARRIVFSGDVGKSDRPLVRDPSPVDEADVVLMESTYGDREHPDVSVEDELARLVNAVAERRGKLLVPAFAIERAQEILYHLARLHQADRIPPIRAFLDSPMATEATAAFSHHRDVLDADTQRLLSGGERVMGFAGLSLVVSRAASREIDRVDEPAIIIAGSGMCTGGRILHHLAHHLPASQNMVLITGYQAHGTLGRELLEGATSVVIRGQAVTVRAPVERLHGLSSHADRTDLLKWLGHLRRPPRQLFLNHGETDAAEALAALIRQRGWSVRVPAYGDVAALD